jgi:hypothetical protein
MKTKKTAVSPSTPPKAQRKPDAKSANDAPAKQPIEPPVELDRRGKPLPPRQRVGGIITPQ